MTAAAADRPPVTRLAPSPTGALHLGNARSFLLAWLFARQGGWRVALRVDDLDGPRVKAGADRQAIADLAWLGLDWDDGPTYQSANAAAHAAALERLRASGSIYPCVCTRAEVDRAATAPHADDATADARPADGSAVYPGTCRGRFADAAAALAETGRVPAWRFHVPDVEISFDDAYAGPQFRRPAIEAGDFVVAKNDAAAGRDFGTPSYQLATVVDDLAAGVTVVVRGDDLLDSTPRQLLLYDALGAAADAPTYAHLPLVVGPDGRRLAKRHGDSRLSAYRDAGVPASRVVALLARWSGTDAGDAATPRELLGRFDPSRLPRSPVVHAAADEAWLRGGSAVASTEASRVP